MHGQNTVNVDQLVDSLSLEQQVKLLTGADFWRTHAFPDKGIPAFKVSDGPNGARGGIFKDGPSTACFPVGVAVAATWDTDLIAQMGVALGEETRIKGAQVLLAPTVNLHRTVFNGRNFECYSEDPWLASEMAVAYIKGVQSTGVGATIKHFVGNDSEYQRMHISSDIPERALRELYLLPFERAIKEASVMCVMTGYNRIGGIYMADHVRLITSVLREEWGFEGLVMTDWYAHHDTIESIRAGCDLEMPGPTRERGEKLLAAVADGRIEAAAIRTCAKRVLELTKQLGRFDGTELPEERSDDLPSTRALIRKLGAAGTVLLKNDENRLPLTLGNGQTVAVIGRAAVEPLIMGGGSANVNAHYRVSPLDALRSACPGVKFNHLMGADIFRYVPTISAPMIVEYFATDDLSGPVVVSQTHPNSEVIWADNIPTGINRTAFSARATITFKTDRAGDYAFSLISAGVSRARINGEWVIDAWSNWRRGDTYFTWGCDEVIHKCSLSANETVEIYVEYSTNAPNTERFFQALRIGGTRLLDTLDIEDAVVAAEQADAVIVFAGLNAEWDNEGLDRENINLPHLQNDLITKVLAANPNTTIVLQTGSPVLLPWQADAHTLLQAWYPGQECGNAIADVLLGKAEPGGRLPQTWPKNIEDTVAFGDPASYPGVDGKVAYTEGVFVGYRHYDQKKITPAFPFGYGLSYTHFEIKNVAVSSDKVAPNETITIGADVTNTGNRNGSEVIQLYVSDPTSTLSRPEKELKAFQKVSLQPGETKQISLSIGMRALAAFDERCNGWLAEAGQFELRIATSVDHVVAKLPITLTADWFESTSPKGVN